MDLVKILEELCRERNRLDAAIRTLETIRRDAAGSTANRRGRKSMGIEERLAVSKRMREYWRQRREQAAREDGPPEVTS
jgi:hypothetical protein